jgi:hypothetical protein
MAASGSVSNHLDRGARGDCRFSTVSGRADEAAAKSLIGPCPIISDRKSDCVRLRTNLGIVTTDQQKIDLAARER